MSIPLHTHTPGFDGGQMRFFQANILMLVLTMHILLHAQELGPVKGGVFHGGMRL